MSKKKYLMQNGIK